MRGLVWNWFSISGDMDSGIGGRTEGQGVSSPAHPMDCGAHWRGWRTLPCLAIKCFADILNF